MIVDGPLFPTPHPVFHHLQCGKAGRTWNPSSCEHHVIGKWQKLGYSVLYIVQTTTWSILLVATISYLCFSYCSESHIKPFLPSFLCDIAQRKLTRPTLTFLHCKQQKAGRKLGTRLFGTNLSEPHTSVIALCMFVCLLACLWLLTLNFKWAHLTEPSRNFTSQLLTWDSCCTISITTVRSKCQALL